MWCGTSYSACLRINDAHFLKGLCHTFACIAAILILTVLTCLQCLLLLGYTAIPPFPPPRPLIALLFPRTLLHSSATDYASIYHVMTRFGLCLEVADIMVWFGFSPPLLGTNKTISPPLPSSYTQWCYCKMRLKWAWKPSVSYSHF